jgi:hypothetical protein
VDHLEVGDEVPLGAEPGGAMLAEVDVPVLLAHVYRQAPGTHKQLTAYRAKARLINAYTM